MRKVSGVYVSYPFCAQKCTYCNFASGVYPRQLESAYMTRLRAELAAHNWSWTPETVYLGGGTPSSMPVDQLASVLDHIPGRPWKEATIEAAPGGITADQAGAWRRAGINRVSLGVQSFVQPEIARTGRKHTASLVAADMAALREAGIESINVDLICGLSGQTAASWDESLDWIERLAPEHVSVYMLEVDEDSRLGRELLLGGVRYGAPDVPSESAIAGCYERAVERLAGMGLSRYEISNFGRPSLHNLKYWRLEPYVGFGADAHSFDAGMRWQNVESAAEYAGRDNPRQEQHPPRDDERFFLGLRLSEGVRPRCEDWETYREPITRFTREGLLETDGHVLRLTNRGVLLSNEVFQEFLVP
jgi:oxygen-independent coproporphyrinogen-3 oxidase